MDRDTVIRLAKKAGFDVNFDIWAVSVDGVHINKELHRFAALVAAHERERILEMCKEGWWDAAGIRHHLEKQT